MKNKATIAPSFFRCAAEAVFSAGSVAGVALTFTRGAGFCVLLASLIEGGGGVAALTGAGGGVAAVAGGGACLGAT